MFYNLIDYNFDEKDDKYIFETDLPGYNKEEIKVELKGIYLNITAKSEDRGEISRTYNTSNLEIKNIEAKYKNGVLVLDIIKNKDNIKTITIN